MCFGYYTMSPSEAGWLRRYQHASFYHNSIVITIIYSKKMDINKNVCIWQKKRNLKV